MVLNILLHFFSGRFCGDKFPPIITSSGRSLWLRFTSDSNIQYTGFKAVYTFIQNPMDNLPDIGKCTFEIGGHESFIGSANISQDRIDHSLAYDTPIDCVWTIRTDEDLGIYIQFSEYKLQTPNDCNSNFIQVSKKLIKKKFCLAFQNLTGLFHVLVPLALFEKPSSKIPLPKALSPLIGMMISKK